MEKFFDKVYDKIYNAIKEDMETITKRIGDETIYGVALVTDEDCISLYLAANTSEYLRKKDLDNLSFMRQYLSEGKIQAIEEGTDSLTKWTPAEWGYSGGKNSGLVEVSKLLFEQEEQDSVGYAQNKPRFFETITSALKRVIDEKGTDTENITFFITLSDGDGIEEIENYSAKQLNSTEMFEKFTHRFDSNY